MWPFDIKIGDIDVGITKSEVSTALQLPIEFSDTYKINYTILLRNKWRLYESNEFLMHFIGLQAREIPENEAKGSIILSLYCRGR